MFDDFITLLKIFANETFFIYSLRNNVELIMFLSRIINEIKSWYWFIEFELVDIVWIMRKIWYMIELLISFIIIFINYDIILSIVKQISFIIINIDKMNLRLMRVSIIYSDLNLLYVINLISSI